MSKQEFIPCTTPRHIGSEVYCQPIRSWHSGTYAGEKLTSIPGSNDRSGCLRDGMADAPLSVTHRLYWHRDKPEQKISAFLSYPNGMGACDTYFWECNAIAPDDVVRFFGPDAEKKMETAI